MTDYESPPMEIAKMRKVEQDHIEKVGEKAFADALARASMCVRQDSRFTGLDRVREPLAFEAALRATGFKGKPFSAARLARKDSVITQDFLDICDELLTAATEAATAKVPA